MGRGIGENVGQCVPAMCSYLILLTRANCGSSLFFFFFVIFIKRLIVWTTSLYDTLQQIAKKFKKMNATRRAGCQNEKKQKGGFFLSLFFLLKLNFTFLKNKIPFFQKIPRRDLGQYSCSFFLLKCKPCLCPYLIFHSFVSTPPTP